MTNLELLELLRSLDENFVNFISANTNITINRLPSNVRLPQLLMHLEALRYYGDFFFHRFYIFNDVNVNFNTDGGIATNPLDYSNHLQGIAPGTVRGTGNATVAVHHLGGAITIPSLHPLWAMVDSIRSHIEQSRIVTILWPTGSITPRDFVSNLWSSFQGNPIYLNSLAESFSINPQGIQVREITEQSTQQVPNIVIVAPNNEQGSLLRIDNIFVQFPQLAQHFSGVTYYINPFYSDLLRLFLRVRLDEVDMIMRNRLYHVPMNARLAAFDIRQINMRTRQLEPRTQTQTQTQTWTVQTGQGNSAFLAMQPMLPLIYIAIEFLIGLTIGSACMLSYLNISVILEWVNYHLVQLYRAILVLDIPDFLNNLVMQIEPYTFISPVLEDSNSFLDILSEIPTDILDIFVEMSEDLDSDMLSNLENLDYTLVELFESLNIELEELSSLDPVPNNDTVEFLVSPNFSFVNSIWVALALANIGINIPNSVSSTEMLSVLANTLNLTDMKKVIEFVIEIYFNSK